MTARYVAQSRTNSLLVTYVVTQVVSVQKVGTDHVYWACQQLVTMIVTYSSMFHLIKKSKAVLLSLM